MCLRKLTSSRSVQPSSRRWARRGTLYVPLRSAPYIQQRSTVAQLNGVEQVGVEHAGSVVMRTRLKRSCSSASLSMVFCSVPAYGRYRSLLPWPCPFRRDLSPVFAAILVNQIFQTLFTPAACASIAASLPLPAVAARLSLVHRPDDRRPPVPPGSWSQTVCTVQTNRGTFTHGEQTLMRVSQF